ncbi:methyl-accepting chemotaxis protein [Perlabentimonas gracilis]|jgi:methyl-accepting chemotaxis protein|uniref:methyl-accepting chemotaxis protein n=1 Tax=Perlabentimonas gracilis TaxID=2715279 RepID=UPI0014084415|nr:methyl-accepting chemotaxis protein [Perlabentimonas gracilis]NHB69079.1 HAMP domain-containing protein [Perlabentimonas gracilis]
MKFRDLKIGTKIMTGFGLVALIALAIGIIGFVGLNRVSKSFHDVADVNMPSVGALQEIELAFEMVQSAHRTLLIPNLDASEKSQQFQHLDNARKRQAEAQALYESLPHSAEEAQMWDEFVRSRDNRRGVNLEFESLVNDMATIDISYPMELLKDLQQFKGDHHELQVRVANAIRSGRTFEGGDDHTLCNLGRWLPNFASTNPRLAAAFNDLREPHGQFHRAVHEVNRLLRNGNNNAAWAIYEREMLPSAENVFKYFDVAIQEAERAVALAEEASRKSLIEALPLNQAAVKNLTQLITYNDNEAATAVNLGDRAVSASTAMVVGGIIVGLVLALILGLLITRIISAPIIKGVGFAQTIAEGDLTAELENEILDRKDEVGQLGKAMQNMVDKLKEVIGSVMLGSDNIAAASMQMSSGSQQVSQGASEQASSAEEVSSSMEEMAANIQQNTDNAQEADKISQKVQDGVSKVGAASQDSLVSIKNIAEKINIINDIAFQTNILALNAAVEAARAGEQGRGFAVVAAEVRKLAERSKIAADEIVALASKSVDVTENAAELMTGLIPEIEKTAKLVQEIAAASMEQSSGSDQVNTAIQQLNQVTQQNAAASEEMATSAEELSSQAEQLKEIIGYFRIDSRRINKFQAESHYAPKKVATPNVQTKQQENTKGVSLKMEGNGKTNKFHEVTSKAKVTSNDGDFENF